MIGAGPAGLTTAELLRAQGYEVHVYDRHDRAGGLLTYGIPGFKLEKPVVMRRVDRLKAAGIVFHEGFEVGRDASMDDLRERHDAILIATGVYKARVIKADGVELDGVVEALDYLTASNRKGFGDAVPAFDSGALNATGKRVVVIGGGDTAMDCVRTAVRQGAASVECLYRRDRDNMPGSKREVSNAEEEGVRFVWLAGPDKFVGADGRVTAVEANAMKLSAADASGRRAPDRRSRRRLHRRGGSGDQGARLRCRGSAQIVRRARPGRDALGHCPRRQRDDDDEPRWRIRRRRHHPWREFGCLGNP